MKLKDQMARLRRLFLLACLISAHSVFANWDSLDFEHENISTSYNVPEGTGQVSLSMSKVAVFEQSSATADQNIFRQHKDPFLSGEGVPLSSRLVQINRIMEVVSVLPGQELSGTTVDFNHFRNNWGSEEPFLNSTIRAFLATYGGTEFRGLGLDQVRGVLDPHLRGRPYEVTDWTNSLLTKFFDYMVTLRQDYMSSICHPNATRGQSFGLLEDAYNFYQNPTGIEGTEQNQELNLPPEWLGLTTREHLNDITGPRDESLQVSCTYHCGVGKVPNPELENIEGIQSPSSIQSTEICIDVNDNRFQNYIRDKFCNDLYQDLEDRVGEPASSAVQVGEEIESFLRQTGEGRELTVDDLVLARPFETGEVIEDLPITVNYNFDEEASSFSLRSDDLLVDGEGEDHITSFSGEDRVQGVLGPQNYQLSTFEDQATRALLEAIQDETFARIVETTPFQFVNSEIHDELEEQHSKVLERNPVFVELDNKLYEYILFPRSEERQSEFINYFNETMRTYEEQENREVIDALVFFMRELPEREREEMRALASQLKETLPLDERKLKESYRYLYERMSH